MSVLPVQIVFVVFILAGSALDKPNKTSVIIKNFTNELSASENAEISAKHLLRNVMTNLKINMTKVLADFRVQIVIHKNHTLGDESRENPKWNDCLIEKGDNLKKIEEIYSDKETECIKNITAETTDKRKSMKQIIKEINNWRKGFKYLLKLCKNEHPYDIFEAEMCLKEYMQNDNFADVIYRLLNLLEYSKSDLVKQVNMLHETLQKCLEGGFSNFMGYLRTLMTDLTTCYNNKLIEVTTEVKIIATKPAFDITRFRCNKYCK